MSTLATKISIWEEKTFAQGGSRRAEIIVDAAIAERVKSKAIRTLGWTKTQLNARYPSVGVDVEDLEIFETVDGALEACSWPFEEFR